MLSQELPHPWTAIATTYSYVVDFSFFNQLPVLLEVQMLILLIAVSSSEVSHQRPEGEGRGKGGSAVSGRGQVGRVGVPQPHFCPPVVSGDASGTRPCGLLVLLVVVGVNVSLLSLLLQDRSEIVFADAAEERADVVGLLDHPLWTARKRDSVTNCRYCVTEVVRCANTNLSDLDGVLCGSSGVVLNFELLH